MTELMLMRMVHSDIGLRKTHTEPFAIFSDVMFAMRMPVLTKTDIPVLFSCPVTHHCEILLGRLLLSFRVCLASLQAFSRYIQLLFQRTLSNAGLLYGPFWLETLLMTHDLVTNSSTLIVSCNGIFPLTEVTQTPYRFDFIYVPSLHIQFCIHTFRLGFMYITSILLDHPVYFTPLQDILFD